MSYLDSNQQDLLTAALNSNNNQQQNTGNMGQQFGNDQFSFDGMDPSLFMNTNNLAMQDFNNFGTIDDSPFLDQFNNGEGNFDFDYNQADGQMIGDLPADDNDDDDEDDDDDHLHDKRKSPDDKDDVDGNNKRREGEVKEPKKPGRKPLTSEPTNVSIFDSMPSILSLPDQHRWPMRQLLTNKLEEKSSESRCPACFQRTKGEAS